MNPPEAQSDSEPTPTYFDPEMADMSEQQFAASLDIEVEHPTFELDACDDGSGGARPILVEREDMASNRVTSSDVGDCGTAESPALPKFDVRESISLLPTAQPVAQDSDWRNQVSAKVSSYKARKPRKERYPSLQLQFEGSTYRAQERHSAPDVIPPKSQFAAEESVSLPAEPRIILEATARVIEFPRPVAPPVRLDELAEPVIDRPRILEAPELLPAPPALGGMLIDSASEAEPERRPGFDMPLLSAPLSQRALAGIIDFMLVTVALAIFGYVLFRMNGPIQTIRPLAEIATALVAVLWPAYQYAFLVFCGTTPGLRVTRLSLNGFDGTSVSRRLRRWRVLASLLSCVSLGLGYVWCFLDEDQLCWHDRITRTHLAPISSNAARS